MSQYVNFFIRHDNGEFISIGDYSRSNPIYGALSTLVPYEDATRLTKEIYNEAYANMTDFINYCENQIKEHEKEINLIVSMNNSVEDKLEAIHANKESNKDLIEDSEMYKAQRYHLAHYFDMDCEWEKNEVWVGIEVSPDYLNEKYKEKT